MVCLQLQASEAKELIFPLKIP